MRRRAWWGDLKIFFATLLGVMHRVAGRVSESLCQLFLKRFSKMIESGLEPTREKKGRSGDRTHPRFPNPCANAWAHGCRGPGQSRNPCANAWAHGFRGPGESRNPCASDRRSSNGFHLLLRASDDRLAATTFPQALAFQKTPALRKHLF